MCPHDDPRRSERPPAPDPLPLPVVDNHTHLDISREGDVGTAVDQVLAEARAVGVTRLVQIGCDVDAIRWTTRLLDAGHDAILGGVALHPNEAPRHARASAVTRGEADPGLGDEAADGSSAPPLLPGTLTTEQARELVEQAAAHPRVRVIGETGLDYFRTGPAGVRMQQDSFRWHIDLAKRTGKVLQIHDRDAHDDVLRILAEEGAPETTVLHCFSGDITMARECIERGYHLSFSGTVTFKSAKTLRNALSITPLEQILVETDAPYLTPSPHRGQTNAPYLVPLTVRAMATTLNVSVPELCAAIDANSERVYGPWR